MRPNTQLDYAVFQLNPTRTRCELHIAAQGMTYKLASGLLKPFIAHLSAAEEQIAGGGYSIRLEPPDPVSAFWFTKGTMERFVRFVSTPEVLEGVSSVETELIELKETMRMQANDASEDNQIAEDYLSKLAHLQVSTGGMPAAPANPEKPAKESLDCAETGTDTTKQRLLRALDARRTMLLQEQGVAFARAIAAGFSVENMGDLILFAENFGATRLREACTNFMALCKKRQESGQWQEDLKLAAAEIPQADMAFGLKHDEVRRASLPNEGRLMMGDIGLEKLTRRGSLDELTGEFWQVAARMRSSGMMEGVNADWSSNWQTPMSGRNQSVREEMQGGVGYLGVNADWSSNWQTPMSGRNQSVGEEIQGGVGYLGGNSEVQDSESLVRGHTIMAAAWQGQPQNHFMHNVHPLSLQHRPMHPSLPLPLGISRPPQPGLPYSPYLGNPYMAQAYAEANGWQMPPPVPPPYLPGHLGYNATPAPTTNEHGDEVPPATQNEGAEPPLFNNNEGHGELPDRDRTQKPASGLLVSKDTQEMAGTQKHLAVNDDQDHDISNELPHDVDGAPHGEMTRRLPIRSSSPSRRSASPLKKVQIGRSGYKRSAIRNINYVTHSVQNQAERENNDRNSSESWSEDGKSDEESKAVEPVRARVQDVIGLFESKKDGNDAKGKPFTKESKRLPAKNSVLSRWTATASGSLERDAGEAEESLANNRIRRGVSGAFAHDVAEIESKQPNVSETTEERASLAEEDMLLFPDRKGASRSKDTTSTAMLAEQGQNESRKMDPADDSFIVPKGRISSRAGESRMLDAHLELASEVGSCSEQLVSDDSFIVFERPDARKEARKMPLNVESETPIYQNPDGGNCASADREPSFEPDDVSIVPDRSEDTARRSCNTPMDDDMQVLPADVLDDTDVGQEQNDVDEDFPLGDDVHEHEDGDMGDKSNVANFKKVSERDAKARAMQEMLERRKAASGSRSGKPNPLAEAQLRAEKLRAYKASLQKSKQEKEEEERKRIEDLKSQRKDRIAARKSQVGGSAAQSPSMKQGPQTPPLSVSRSSPTKISHKLSGSSPRSSINVTASVSPNVPKIKPASGNKTPTGTQKANENALSHSVPSLNELKKESSKAALAVRSSTGSQRLSQLKKTLKDADSNSSPKANGHTEEKRRSLPFTTVRKGIPPAKDTKGESLPVVKPTKGLTAATKQQKKLASSRGGVKASPAKEHALETADSAASLEQIDATNDAAGEGLILAQDSEAGIDIQQTSTDIQEVSTDILETSVNNACSSVQEIGTVEQDSGYAQIRAPASNEPELLSTADDFTCLSDESSKVELVPASTEALKVAEESKEASNVASASHTDSLACSEGEHSEAEGDTNAGEEYHAPIAHISPTDDNSVTSKELDVRKDELSVRTELPNISLPGQYNPHALPSDSPLHTPPKSLPRLHEAIQQAHSPESNPGDGISKKKRGESGSQKTSKDHHAKGLKRLLLLGRRSNRSTTQNAADWVSVSMTSEVDDDGEGIPSSNVKNVGIRSAATNAEGISSRADKPRSESNSGSSSSKGSRSFFSLSTFRGKSDGKS